MSRRPRRRNCRLFAPRFFLKRISSSSPADAAGQKFGAGYPPSAEGRRPAPPQNAASVAKQLPHFSGLCKTQLVASQRITDSLPVPREAALLNYRNLWSLHIEIG